MRRGRAARVATAVALAALACGAISVPAAPAAAHHASAVTDPITGGVLAPASFQPVPAKAPQQNTGGTPPVPSVTAPPPSTSAPSPGGAQAPTGGSGLTDIPSDYLAIYRSAGTATGIDWRVLAAIGKNESNHGRSKARGVASGVNAAGCCSGPMQICTVKSCGNVWQHYMVDGNLDGTISVYEPADAILGAAAILRDLQGYLGSQDPRLLMAGYNAGPGNVRRYRGVPPFPETQAYVAAGLRYIASLT